MKQYTSIDAMRKAKLSMPYLSIENVKELIEQAYKLGMADGEKAMQSHYETNTKWSLADDKKAGIIDTETHSEIINPLLDKPRLRQTETPSEVMKLPTRQTRRKK